MFDTELSPLITAPLENGVPEIGSLVSSLRSNCDRLISLLESAGSQTAKEALVSLLRSTRLYAL